MKFRVGQKVKWGRMTGAITRVGRWYITTMWNGSTDGCVDPKDWANKNLKITGITNPNSNIIIK